MVKVGDVDVMLCGLDGNYDGYLVYVEKVIGFKDGVQEFVVLNVVLLLEQMFFIIDIYVNDMLDVEQLVCIVKVVVEEVVCFGVLLKVVFLLYFNYGSFLCFLVCKMVVVYEVFKKLVLEVEFVGELYGDVVLLEKICNNVGLVDSGLMGVVNVLVCFNLDVVNIFFNVLKISSGQGIIIGLILLGVVVFVYVLILLSIVCCVINMIVLVVVKVQDGKFKV